MNIISKYCKLKEIEKKFFDSKKFNTLRFQLKISYFCE